MTDTYAFINYFTHKTLAIRVSNDKLFEMLNGFRFIGEEPKKTSIHLVKKSTPAGVETRKSYYCN